MRKIHPGFIALAILGGPASIILAHQKLTYRQETYSSLDLPALFQQAYSKCSEMQRSVRPSSCDDYIKSVDQCAARHGSCDRHMLYDVLTTLSFVPASSGHTPATKPL